MGIHRFYKGELVQRSPSSDIPRTHAFAKGEKINGETVVDDIENISIPIDIVDVFRPSKETPQIAEQTVKVGAKVFWLQYGIQNDDAKKIVESKKIFYISNKCIKQEYQRLFLKVSPVFPALKNT